MIFFSQSPGAPTYYGANTSITQVFVAPTSSNVPTPGSGGCLPTCTNGINTIMFDPDFGTKMVRASDPTVTTCTDNDMITSFAGNGDENLFNSASPPTAFIMYCTDGTPVIMGLNASTLQVCFWTGSRSTSSLPGNTIIEFSRTTPTLIFATLNTTGQSKVLNYSLSGSPCSGSISASSTYYDFNDGVCLQSATMLASAVVKMGLQGTSAGDSTVSVYFSSTSGQGSAGDVLVCRKSASGVEAWLTANATMYASFLGTGYSGSSSPYSGAANYTGFSGVPNFTLHHCTQALDGWIACQCNNHYTGTYPSGSVGAACVTTDLFPYLWLNGSTSVIADTTHNGGHWCSDNVKFYTMPNSPTGQWYALTVSGGSGAPTALLGSIPSSIATPFDQHCGQNSLDADSLIGATTMSTVALSGGNQPFAWWREIDLFGATGTVRVAHTNSTQGSSSTVFDCTDAIGAISQDRNFFMWSSDWMGTLGVDNSSGPRCDVFIADLRYVP